MDFLASNDAIGHLREVQRNRDGHTDLSDFLLGVRSEYLAAAFSQAEGMCGSIDEYFESIGVSKTRRRQLSDALSVNPFRV